MRALCREVLLLLCLVPAACASEQTTDARMRHAEKQSLEAESTLDRADAAMDKLEDSRAEELLAEAKELLADRDIAAYPEHEMLKSRQKKGEERLIQVREEIKKRELERRIAEQRAKVTERRTELDLAVAALALPAVSGDDLAKLGSAREALTGELASGRELEAKDPGYSAFVGEQRAALDEAALSAKKVEKLVAFRDGPAAAGTLARAQLEEAAAEQDLPRRKEMFTEALSKLKTCSEGSKKMLIEEPALAKAKMELVAGNPTSPAAVEKGCAAEVKSLAKKIKALEQTIRQAEKLAAKAAKAAAKKEAQKTTKKAPKKKKRG